jgi:hypothetical protein
MEARERWRQGRDGGKGTERDGGKGPAQLLQLLELQVQNAEKVWNAAREKRSAAAREEEDARRLWEDARRVWEASQEKTKMTEREESEAQQRVEGLKFVHSLVKETKR